MSQQLDRHKVEAMVRAKLIALIRLAAAHGIRIDTLMYEALDRCDAAPPFSN